LFPGEFTGQWSMMAHAQILEPKGYGIKFDVLAMFQKIKKVGNN